jgi:hypothetical protein
LRGAQPEQHLAFFHHCAVACFGKIKLQRMCELVWSHNRASIPDLNQLSCRRTSRAIASRTGSSCFGALIAGLDDLQRGLHQVKRPVRDLNNQRDESSQAPKSRLHVNIYESFLKISSFKMSAIIT